MSDIDDDVGVTRSARLRDRKAKVLPPRAAKLSFKYESQDLENAVSAVLCGMSIKEAASLYTISRNVLKQALSDEIDMEPQEDGTVVDIEEKTDSDGVDLISSRVAECQAAYESQKSENAKRKVELAMKDGIFGDEIEVTCGFCSGILYRKKFFCPGLHCECILTDDQWVTPKQFSIMGGKASLKNWKNAIRINNVNLRNFMEQGSLDFWDHQINCSGKCYHKTSGGPGKYQSKINCLERKTLGNIEALTQTLGDQKSPSMRLEENLNEDIPSFVPMVQNVASSTAFSVLRKAQGKDDQDSEDNQPVFPSPVIKTEQLDSGDYGTVKSSSTTPSIDPPVLNITPVTTGDIPQQQSLLLRNPVIQAQKQKILQSQQCQSGGAAIQAPRDGGTGILSSAPGNSTVRYLIQNGVIKGQVKQIGNNQFVLQNNVTDQPPEILQVASSFPDIESIMKDSKKFWEGIYEIGLLTEIFTEIKAKMRSMKHEMYNCGITEENAERLSHMVNNLGLQTKVKYKLANHKVAAEAQNRKIQEEINELQKKMADSQKRQAELKRKSHCFEKLLQKRPRLEKHLSVSDDSQEKHSKEDVITLGTITKEELDTDEQTDENESETNLRNLGKSKKVKLAVAKKSEEKNTQSEEDYSDEDDVDDDENTDTDSEKSS